MSNREKVGLGFVGHTDTVEGSGDWRYDKFSLTRDGNNLYGLGACDMKSGIASIIAAISQTDFSKMSKGMKVYLTFDEEIGFSGIKEVIKFENEFPKTIIIGEPTNNEIIVGSKGLIEYKISFNGVKAHSSTPDKGKNAIMMAVAFINELSQFYELKIKSIEDSRFDIPYTTMNIGKIDGGTAINSVPDSCEILIDFRTTDKLIESIIERKITKLTSKYKAKLERINKLPAFLNISELSDKTCNFITEASFLKNNRIILGAGPVTAHEVNEYITVESLYKLVEQYKEIIEQKCM